MFGTYIATLDDGTERTVSIDNRDFIAFRRRGYRDLGMPSPDPVTALMTEVGESEDVARGLELIEVVEWLLWNAGDRAGAWACDFDAFIEKECASFRQAEAVTADPTRAGSVDSSPS